VAIKTVRYRLGQPGADIITLKEKLYHQARAIAKLNHPNIAVIHDVDEDHDLCYIVMEYLDGTDLRALIDKERRLEWERAVHLMVQACNALHYAHSMGIVHLDLKPGNMVLQRHHGNLKVTDFSIDKSGQRPPAALHNSESGAHLYLAPEQRDSGRVDLRADIFSLGVVFYELLTGETPCLDESIDSPARTIAKKSYVPPSLQNIELPVEVDEVVAGALNVNPEQRYQTAEAFRDALVRLQTSVLLI
jgi:serine/threonine-protein kinase